MKKILTVLISAMLIACVMSVSAFALVFDFEPADGTPVIDGVIEEGEYAWTTYELDKLVEFPGEFYVTVEHTDGMAMGIEYLFDVDDDFIYLAVKERTSGYVADILYDLVFCTVDAQVKDTMIIDVRFTRNNDYIRDGNMNLQSQAYAPDFTLFVVNGSEASSELDTYVVEANGTFMDDGARNNNYIEIKLDRAAIETLVGGEISGMGLRMTACTGEDKTGETVYGDEESAAYPADGNTHIGYHFIAFESGALDSLDAAPTETEPTETEPAETEPAETEPAETTPTETEPAETTPVETEPAETEILEEKGCGASVVAVAVAVVAMLGTCTAFIIKK